MKQTGYLTKNLNINTFSPYWIFYKLLHDKKRNISYTTYISYIFFNFKKFCKNIILNYLGIYFLNFNKNYVYLNNITYFYILRRCKYVNVNFFLNLTKNAYIISGKKFLFIPNVSTDKQLLSDCINENFSILLKNNKYVLYKNFFYLSNLHFIKLLLVVGLLSYYSSIQFI